MKRREAVTVERIDQDPATGRYVATLHHAEGYETYHELGDVSPTEARRLAKRKALKMAEHEGQFLTVGRRG